MKLSKARQFQAMLSVFDHLKQLFFGTSGGKNRVKRCREIARRSPRFPPPKKKNVKNVNDARVAGRTSLKLSASLSLKMNAWKKIRSGFLFAVDDEV